MVNVQAQLSGLLRMVQEADDAVMDVYNAHSAVVKMKADNTPVTQADMASHQIISAGLLRLFPNIPVVSEEGDQEANIETVQSAPAFWLVDPIDGTREFLARTDHFTVCIALVENGEPIFGIISAPALGVTYYGGPGPGSFKKVEGQELQRIAISKEKTKVVLGSRSDLNEATKAYIDTHFAGATIAQVGSQLKLPQIAEGLADAYPRINSSLHLWDLAAGEAILVGAGGTVAKLDGSPVNYRSATLQVGDFIAQS
jgi:3'(2'), 5'-bisphosphate nucleotidase